MKYICVEPNIHYLKLFLGFDVYLRKFKQKNSVHLDFASPKNYIQMVCRSSPV